MSGAAQSPSSPIVGLDAAGAAGALRRELVGWAWLAVGALAVAGVFALLLALSRVPGMDRAPLWPIGFFYKGLVIHVVFSLVIWLMGVFAFLVTVATQRVGGDDPRAAPLGRIGQGVVLIAFPVPVRAGVPRRDPAGTDQLRPAHPPSGLRSRAPFCWRSACSRR